MGQFAFSYEHNANFRAKLTTTRGFSFIAENLSDLRTKIKRIYIHWIKTTEYKAGEQCLHHYTQQKLFYFYLIERDKCLFIFLSTYNTVLQWNTSISDRKLNTSIIAEKFATQLCIFKKII